MKLVSLQIHPKTNHGWKSEKLIFGDEITHLFAANGAGKTPLIEAIVFSLGYPVRFRDAIYQHCDCVELVVKLNNTELTFKRKLERNNFNIQVDLDEYHDELTFSEMLFKLINKNIVSLISTTRTEATPYISQFLHLNYVNQETGYVDIYDFQPRFIQDQFSEMMRISLNLPAKNIFNLKKYQFDIEKKLKAVERSIVNLKIQIDHLKSNDSIKDQNELSIQDQLQILSFEYKDLLANLNNNNSANIAYTNIISAKQREYNNIQYEINEIQKRQNSFEQISNEIQMEISTLTLNEKAKRLLTSSSEICNNRLCGLFSFSSEQYSQNLLYLKDQVKDLQNNFEADTVIILRLQQRQEELNAEIALITKESDQKTSSIDNTALSTIEKNIHQLKLQSFLFNEITIFEKEYVKQLNLQEHYTKELAANKTTAKTNSDILEKKRQLKELFLKWLDILETPNIDRNISFSSNHEFIPILGNEQIKDIKGSTKTRCILAYKAATFELMCYEDNNPRFFILDTPKQQELDDIDLDKYIRNLKNLAKIQSAQIVFSSSDYEYLSNDKKDTQWLPKFSKTIGAEIKMHYLIEQ